MYPRLYRLENRKDCVVKDRVKSLGGVNLWVWEWGRELFDRELVVAKEIEDKLKDCGIVNNRVDRWVKVGDKEEVYSTKEGYKVLNKKEEVSPLKMWVSVIWNNLVPLKVIVFVWKLLQDRIPSQENLAKRGLIINTSELGCKRCGVDVMESSWHIFGECAFSREVWSLVYRWVNCTRGLGSSVEDLLDRHCRHRCGVDKKVWILLWHVTVWNIWLARNAYVFKNDKISPITVFEKIQLFSWSWLKGKGKLSHYKHFDSWLIDPQLCF